MSDAPVAVLHGVTCGWRGRAVLHDASLTVSRGEVVAVLGPNGAGKSTLLQVVAGLIRPMAGTVRVEGQDAWKAAVHQAGSVGLITAAPGLYPLLTGRENLDFFGGLYGLSSDEVGARIEGFADAIGLRTALETPAGEGSSGMQQKLSLARALLMRPALLLLDEPTANLDPFASHVILSTIRAYADQGHAVLWVTHDLHGAASLCDRAVLVDGTVVADRPLDGPKVPPASTTLAAWWTETLGTPS